MLIVKALSLTDVSAQGQDPKGRMAFFGKLDPKFFGERVWIYREPYFAMITFMKYTDSIEHRMHQVARLNDELKKEIEIINRNCETMLKQVRELSNAQSEKLRVTNREKELFRQHYLSLAQENYSLRSELEKAKKPLIDIDLHRLDRLTSIALIIQGTAIAGVLWVTILVGKTH